MGFFSYFDKQYLKKKLIAVCTAVVALGLVVYISYHLTGNLGESVTLLDARVSKTEKNLNVDGYILREEQLLFATSATAGSVTPAVGDSTRLGRYDKAVDIYEFTKPDALKRITEIDRQLDLLERKQESDISVVNTSGIDSTIFRNVEQIRTYVESGRYGDAVTMRTTFLVNLKKREILKGNITDFSAQIARLEEEKSALKASLGTLLESVTTPVAGYYFADTDGYENIFRAEDLDAMSYEEFMTLTERAPETEDVRLCVGKIVTDYRWYIACPMTKTEAGEMSDGETYTLTFPYNASLSLPAVLDHVIPALPGTGAVAVFRCTTMPENFEYTRMQPVSITTAEYEGFSIPISALRVQDGYEGVFVLDQVTVAFRRIRILYEKGDEIVCTGAEPLEDCPYQPLKTNEVILVNGKNLYDGKVMSGK